jgi:hypothetical protein
MKSSLKKKTAKPAAGSHGGYRPGAGRKGPPDPENWGPVTCMLRKQTIQALRDGAGTKAFGSFLQWHLDRHPLPPNDVYQRLINNEPIIERVRGRKTQVLYAGSTTQATRRRKIEPRAKQSISELLKARLEAKYGAHDGNGKDRQG